MNFYEMTKIMELSQAINKQDPVPLSQIPLKAAQVAVGTGRKDGADPKDDIAAIDLEASGPVSKLRPTQSQLKSSNFVGMIIGGLLGSFPLKDMNAIVSGDDPPAIMDGHHRWAAALTINPNETVNYVKVDLPLEKLITLLNIYTKGKLGNKGKPAQGEDIKTAFSNAKKLLSDALNQGIPGKHGKTPQQVAEAYGNVRGANGDTQKGLNILINNIDFILSDPKLTSPASNLARHDMPVIEIGEDAKPAITQLVKDLQDGNIDHMQPFSQEVYKALKVDNSTGQQNVMANQGQTNQQNVMANQGQTNQQNVMANQGQTNQQNVMANQGQTNQQNVMANQGQTNQQNVMGYGYRQAASTEYEGPSLNEWLVLAGINEYKN